MTLQEYLRQAIIDNQIDKAIKDLNRHLKPGDSMYDEAALMANRLDRLERDYIKDVVNKETYELMRNQFSSSLLALIKKLPQEQPYLPLVGAEHGKASDKGSSRSRARGITESRFKWILFFSLIIMKGIILLTISEIGAFTLEQEKTLRGLMLPVFSASVILMFKHLWDTNRAKSKGHSFHARIELGNQVFTYFILIAYLISILLAFRDFATKDADFSKLLSWVNNTEVFMGAALGYIISTLFKEPEKD